MYNLSFTPSIYQLVQPNSYPAYSIESSTSKTIMAPSQSIYFANKITVIKKFCERYEGYKDQYKNSSDSPHINVSIINELIHDVNTQNLINNIDCQDLSLQEIRLKNKIPSEIEKITANYNQEEIIQLFEQVCNTAEETLKVCLEIRKIYEQKLENITNNMSTNASSKHKTT